MRGAVRGARKRAVAATNKVGASAGSAATAAREASLAKMGGKPASQYGTKREQRLLRAAFDACDQDDGESDGLTSARTAALMVSAIVPDVRSESVLAVIQHLHGSKYSADAWAKGKRTFETSTDVAEDIAAGAGGGARAMGESPGYAGEYKVLRAAAVRQGSAFDSPQAREGPKLVLLSAGQILQVTEGLIMPSGKVRLRYKQGWFSLINNEGQLLVERTDGGT